MTPDDLARIHSRAFFTTRSWSAPEFANLLASDSVILCGDLRSFALGRTTLDEAEVLTIATDPAFQRQGLARAALSAFEIRAATANARRILLEVAADNIPAKSLYENMNYQIVGHRKSYYTTPDARKVDALVMAKQLS